MAEDGDKLLACVDCGVQFLFTAREQAFYQERSYQPPRRCKVCREKRKSSAMTTSGGPASHGSVLTGGARPAPRPGSSQTLTATAELGEGGQPREQFKVNCTSCGIETTVPFKPDPNRPVYCRTCYLNRRKTGG